MTEKKLKIASENIRMSDELKERIMKKCESKAEHISSDGYTDHVYQVETVKPRKWLKVISGIAACAVIAGGVGAGVVYMSRQGVPSAELDDVETTQEVSDTVEETSPNRLVIDDIMDYRFIDDSLNDYVQSILTVLGEYLENNEITEGDAIPSLMQVGMDFSNGSRELHIYENNILTTVDEEGKITYYNIDSRKLFEALDKVMFVANDPPDNMNIKDVTDEEGVYTAGGILSEYFNRENIRMYVYCDNMDMYTPAMILNGEEPKIGFSEPIELTDEMQYVIVDYMDEQTSCEPPECMSFNTYIAVIDENDSEHPLAKVTFYDEGCMAFEIQKDDNTLVRYWMTGNVTGFGKLLNDVMGTEEEHDTDNAEYYFPGGNFVKMGNADYECKLVGKGTLTDEQSAQVQDIFYGYDWAAHEVTDTSDLGLVSVFSFKWDNIDGAERHVIVCENGYIYYFDRSETDYNEHIYKFDNTEIEDKIREMFGF